MSLLNYDKDQLNRAIIDGLYNQIVDELRKVLIEKAKCQIESIVKNVASQIKTKIESGLDYRTHDSCIRLEIILKREDE